jgi:hypothetical protein
MTTLVTVFTIGSFLSADYVMAQFRNDNDFIRQNYPSGNPDNAEFHFVRLMYNQNSMGSDYFFQRGQAWTVDWPDAEYHLLQGINRLTMIDAPDSGVILSPGDEEIFDYPWMYAVEVGNWYLSDDEAAHMREYLLRGGFLMVDDFHGDSEWVAFLTGIRKVFPDRAIVDIQENHESMHTLYDLDYRIQIPSRMYSRTGQTFEKGGITPHWRGIYDDNDRLMVIINFNMDLGDAWEHADWPDYPEEFTALAYRFGINYIIYSMTH